MGIVVGGEVSLFGYCCKGWRRLFVRYGNKEGESGRRKGTMELEVDRLGQG